LLLQPRSCLCAEVRSSPAAQGQAGNAVQYITRNQALKKLQLKLSEFRWRLPCWSCLCWSFALLHFYTPAESKQAAPRKLT